MVQEYFYLVDQDMPKTKAKLEIAKRYNISSRKMATLIARYKVQFMLCPTPDLLDSEVRTKNSQKFRVGFSEQMPETPENS